MSLDTNTTQETGAIGSGNQSPEVSNTSTAALTPQEIGQAANSTEWFGSFQDDDLKGYVQSKGFKSSEAVAKSYQQLEKFIGEEKAGNTIVLPKTREDAEGWNSIYDRLGRPQNPEGYGIGLDEKGNINTFSKEASNVFHKIGLSTDQGQAISKWFDEKSASFQKATIEAKTAQFKVEEEKLRSEWGAQYVDNVATARTAQKALGLKDEEIDAISSTLGHRTAMNLLKNVGALVSEHNYVSGNGAEGSTGGMDISQARYELKKLTNDSDFGKRLLKGDLDAKNQVARLTNIINKAKG